MKLTYFHYHLKRHDAPTAKIRRDLSTLIFQFCAFDRNPSFKTSFETADAERIFLFWVAGNTYLLINTKSQEIIKAIDSSTIVHSDLYNRLTGNESLGFASYLYLTNRFYGLASTMHGPKNTVFTSFMNDLLRRIGLTNHTFVSGVFETQSTRGQALTLPVVGMNTIEVGPGNNIFLQLAGMLGFGNTQEVDSLEICIKPAKRRNMVQASREIGRNLSSDDLRKYVVRAKASLTDALTDYYIAGTGVLADSIDNLGEAKILAQIQQKVAANTELQAHLADLNTDPLYNDEHVPIVDDFCNPSGWQHHFPGAGVP